jgi:hypothetical protein
MNELGNPPKNYLVESILVTIFCCMPLGIVGIVFAAQVNSKFSAGDIDGANRASADAKKWMKWGLIAGIAAIALYFIFVVGIAGISILNGGN